MSVSDQAFIRAYREDVIAVGTAPMPSIHVGMDSVVAPPHANFTSAVGASIPHEPAPHFGLGQSPKASLSSLSAASFPPSTSIASKPSLEVDAVRWPTLCETILSRHADRFSPLAAELRYEAEAGNKVTAITGLNRGEGRTTLVLCLARQLAQNNRKLALVDADFAKPNLAISLGIGVQRGWESVLAGEESLWEIAIESLSDHLVLVPLANELPGEIVTTQIYRLAATLGELAERYDMVLIDAGPLGDDSGKTSWLLEAGTGISGVILAHDVRLREANRLATACLQLAEARQRQLGIAEMFA